MTFPWPSVAWRVEALLGEGPVWDAAARAVWFVDIKRGNLHRHDPVSGENRTLQIGGRPSFVLPDEGGGLILGNGLELQRVVDGGRIRSISTINMPAHNRTNDATVDTAGRLWFGTMDDEELRSTGAIHLFDGMGVTAIGGECIVTNGPAISADGRWLFHVDTLAGSIWRFAVEGDRLRDGRVFIRIAPEHGFPDGVTLDSEGCLWVGLWQGWGLRRYAPDGELLSEVKLPCANVTKVAFGGADLATAFVTTASAGLSDEERSLQPLAGSLFSFPAPAPGVLLPHVSLDRVNGVRS